MTSSNAQDGHRPGSGPAHTSAVGLNRDLSGRPGHEKIAPGLATPPTASQLENLERHSAVGRLIWGRFIGRAEEMAALRAAIDASLGGQASLVMVVGEPGIGKTRLAEEAGAYARSRGVKVLVGHCYEGEAASPYSAIVEAIREYASTRPDDALKAEMGDSASAIAKLVPEIHKRVPELTPGPAANDPREEQMRLFDSVAALLGNASKANPIMLVLEDLHWGDRASLLLLQHLARRLKDNQLVLVGTYRDVEVDRSHPLSAMLAELRRERHYERLLLRGLSESEVKELIEAIYQQEVTGGGEAFVRAVLRETEGNPFFIEEVLRHLVESGTSYRRDGRWVIDAESIAGLRVPEGVRDVVGRRLSRLSERTHRVLEAAAVLGREFEFEVLVRMNELGENPIWSAVEEGLNNRLVVESRGGGRPRYAFTHALVRQTLVEGLSLPRRQDLHLKAAQAIESVHQRNLEPHVAALANHYRMVGAAADSEKTIDYSIRAGNAAFALFAYEEAGMHWRAALELMDELGGGDRTRRAKLLWRLGDESVSDRAKALEYLETAAPLFEELGDSRAAYNVHLSLANLRSMGRGAMDVRRAMAHLKKAEAFLAGQPDSHHHALFYIHMAAVAYISAGGCGDGLAAAKRAMEICERLDPQEPADLRLSTGRSEQSGLRLAHLLDSYWSVAAAQSSLFLVYSGSVTEGLRLADQARRRADTIHDTASASTVAWIGAGNHNSLRNPREAQEWCKSELAKPRTANVVFRRVRENMHRRAASAPIEVHGQLVLACVLAGELTQARAYLAEAHGVNKLPILSFFEGEWEIAGKMLTAEVQQSRAAGQRLGELIDARDLARVHRFAGEGVQAVQVLQGALEISLDCGMTLFELAIRSSLATMAADAGDAAEALPHLQRCREIVGAGENWFGRAGDVQRAEAVVAAAQGEYPAAEAHFEKAITTFQRYCAPWEEADTLRYWGRALLAAGERARAIEKFDAAIEVYRSRGAGTRFVEYVMADKMRAHSSTSTHPAAKARSHSARADSEIPSGEDVFRKEGEFWTISYESRTFRLKDAKGLHYIAYLLSHPGEKFRVHDLVAVVEGPPEYPKASVQSLPTLEVSGDLGDLGPILDDKAKASYRRRRQELCEELDEAEAMNDEGRAERTRAEIEMLEQQLRAAVGLGGRDRKTSAHAERARVAVTRNIRAVLGKIAEEHPPLGRHLNAAIKTGYLCAYFTEPERTVAWKL